MVAVLVQVALEWKKKTRGAPEKRELSLLQSVSVSAEIDNLMGDPLSSSSTSRAETTCVSMR